MKLCLCWPLTCLISWAICCALVRLNCILLQHIIHLYSCWYKMPRNSSAGIPWYVHVFGVHLIHNGVFNYTATCHSDDVDVCMLYQVCCSHGNMTLSSLYQLVNNSQPFVVDLRRCELVDLRRCELVQCRTIVESITRALTSKWACKTCRSTC